MSNLIEINNGSPGQHLYFFVKDKDESLDPNPDTMPMPAGTSADTIINDFGGRQRDIMLRALLIEGYNLGSGTGVEGITNNGSKITAADNYMFNVSNLQHYLIIPNRAGSFAGLAHWRHKETAGDVNKLECLIRFTEGEVY